jgi:hypothetical protein
VSIEPFEGFENAHAREHRLAGSVLNFQGLNAFAIVKSPLGKIICQQPLTQPGAAGNEG